MLIAQINTNLEAHGSYQVHQQYIFMPNKRELILKYNSLINNSLIINTQLINY